MDEEPELPFDEGKSARHVQGGRDSKVLPFKKKLAVYETMKQVISLDAEGYAVYAPDHDDETIAKQHEVTNYIVARLRTEMFGRLRTAGWKNLSRWKEGRESERLGLMSDQIELLLLEIERLKKRLDTLEDESGQGSSVRRNVLSS